MQIVLIVLTSAILMALFILCFWVGYQQGKKSKETPMVTEENAEQLVDLANWLMYQGGKK